MQKTLAALALLSISTAAIAQDEQTAKLTGDLTITSRNWSDPPPGQTKDRVAFFLTGAGAKRVYDAMPAKAVRDRCEDGMRRKTAGNLECSRARDGTHICMFAIMLTNGQSRPYGEC